MTLKDYIDNLKRFAKEHPEALKKQAIYSSDSEGNSFHQVLFHPTKALYDGNYQVDPKITQESEDKEYNAVIIN